jgi:hypothetical protein
VAAVFRARWITQMTLAPLHSRRDGQQPTYVLRRAESIRFDHEFHARASSRGGPVILIWIGIVMLVLCWLLWQGLHQLARWLGIGG